MSNNSHSSAGTYVSEKDLSQRIANASTSIGVIVGSSNQGPVMERTFVTTDQEFIAIFGKPDPRYSYMHYCALAYLAESGKLYVTRIEQPDALTAGAYLTVDDLEASTPRLQLTNFDRSGTSNVPRGKFDPFNTLGFDPTTPGIENILLFFCASNPGAWNNSLFVRVRPSNARGVELPDDPYVFYVEVFIDYTSNRQQPNESFLVSRDMRLDGFGRQMNIEEVINNRSNLIRVRNNPYGKEKVKVLMTASEFFDGATNGAPLENGTPRTEGMVNRGWDLYRDPEQLDVNILINGGYSSPGVQGNMEDICRQRMDCIAVLDMPPGEQDLSRAITYRREVLNLDSSYAAIYSPDLKILDKYNDRVLYVPPSGHVAATYAYTDHHAETWFAPAGVERGDLDVLGVRVVYGQDARDVLNDAQINPIRVIPRMGYKVWGADTLQTMASALSNVNVRRLLNFIEKSVSVAALYSVFNPNTDSLRSKLTEMTDRFLRPIRGNRGLYWSQSVCDETNNPKEVVAAGDVILDVYLDPVLPAKRIHLNATIVKTGGATFKESAS